MDIKNIPNHWYYVVNGQRVGPITFLELKNLCSNGKLLKTSLIWKPGMANWKAAGEEEVLRESFSALEFPPQIPLNEIEKTSSRNAELEPGNSGQSLLAIKKNSLKALESIDLEKRKQQALETFNLYRLFWSRVLKSDFSYISTTPQESKILESVSEPVLNPLAQAYASWRRSLLMICLLMLGITIFFNGIDLFSVFRNPKKHSIMIFHAIFLFFIQVISFLLCLISAIQWGNLRRSRSFVRFAWIVQFVGPFLLFVLPLSLFVSDKVVLMILGLNSVKILTPKIFSLFPGLIRCSLTVKTLLPETSAPGWLGILIAPFYALFLCVAAVASLQTSNIILGVGFGLIAVGMSVVVFKSRDLLKPNSREEASKIVFNIKRIQSIFQGLGISLIVLHVFLNFEINFSFFNSFLLFVFTFIGNVTLLTVVMSDLMLAMIRQGSIQAKEFANSPMAVTFNDRLDQLASCGLTDLEVGETKLAVDLGSRGMGLAKLAASKGANLFQKPNTQSSETNESGK